MEILLAATIFLLLVIFCFKKLCKYLKFNFDLDQKTGFLFLIASIVIGFFLRLDYSENRGCFLISEAVFETKNITFSVVSLGLIVWAFITKNKRLQKVLCSIELLYWLGKLIFVKGGYIVGIASSPSFEIVLFDLISIFARLFVISAVLSTSRFYFVKLASLSFLLISIKILIFSTPLTTVYYENKQFKAAQEIRKELIGQWEGSIAKISNQKIIQEQKTIVQIDSTHIYFDSLQDLKNYRLSLVNPAFGNLINSDIENYYSLIIQKLSKDSLCMKIDDHNLDSFSVSLKRIKNY